MSHFKSARHKYCEGCRSIVPIDHIHIKRPNNEQQEQIDHLESADTDTGIDGETFRDSLANDDDFRDMFESGQPMGDWDY